MSDITNGKMVALLKAIDEKRDVLRYPTKIDPTGDTFDPAASDLDKVTDNDLTTYATGSKSVSGAAIVGNFKFDLGFVPTKPLDVEFILGVTADAGNVVVYLDQSTTSNFATTGRANINTNNSPTTEKILPLYTLKVTQRYFKIMIMSSATATVTANLYHCSALKRLKDL